MVTFLHTSDWQLGMTRWFLQRDFSSETSAGKRGASEGNEAQSRFDQDRLDAIGRVGQIATKVGAEFIVVAGDVFDSNTLPERILSRALDEIRSLPVPVYLLPGNHDAFDASSIYRRREFKTLEDDDVYVLSNSNPRKVRPGVEIIGVPLHAKVNYDDPLTPVLAELEPTDDIRVIVAHGQVEAFGAEVGGTLSVSAVEKAVAERKINYVAVGDSHSTAQLDSDGYMWFSGAHETTDFDDIERDSGNILEVQIDESSETDAKAVPCATPTVIVHKVGKWSFHCSTPDLGSFDDIETWLGELDQRFNKPRTAIKYSLSGTVNISQMATIEKQRQELARKFAAFYKRTSGNDLTVVPDDGDIAAFGLTGFPLKAAEELQELSLSEKIPAADQQMAADALGLLARLSQAMKDTE